MSLGRSGCRISSQPAIFFPCLFKMSCTRRLKSTWRSWFVFIPRSRMKAWMRGFAFHCLPLTSSPPMCTYSSGNSAATSPRTASSAWYVSSRVGSMQGSLTPHVRSIAYGPGPLASSG